MAEVSNRWSEAHPSTYLECDEENGGDLMSSKKIDIALVAQQNIGG